MKKSGYFHLLTIMMVAILGVFYISCSKDDDESDNNENTEIVSNQDPDGTIVLNMTSGAKDNYYKIGELGEIHIDAANNFRGKSNTSFVSVGLVGGLSKIIQIPKSGWAESAAVVSGTGYVMRYGYNSYQYARIYVVDYLGTTYTDDAGNTYGEITGATIKYQAPFQLPIKLAKSSISFGSGGGSMALSLENPTTAIVEVKPEWCGVTVNDSRVMITVTENLTAEQRQGDIVLKNASNSVKISVTQKGASSPMFQAGSGTAQDPYQIKTSQQLKSITKALNAHFILTADITLNEEANGSGWDPIGKQETPFTGTFIGQGHIIKNLWLKRPTTNGVGLFGYIKNATITGIRLEIGSNGLNGGSYVGGICGYAKDNSTMSKCSVSGAISGKDNVGGVCGYLYGYSSMINTSQCFSEGTLTSNGGAGGIVGGVYSGYTTISISDCYSTISLSAKNCYGISNGGSVTKCYYAGKASPQNSIFSCDGTYTYFDKTIIATTNYRDNGNARTTSQMRTQSNYEGWDFINTWKITEGKTYPTLRCFDK